MLLRFVVANFLSISDEIDFAPFPYKKLRNHRHHIYDLGEAEVLKTAAIYGANGSGKSNFVKAVGLLQAFVTRNHLRFGKRHLEGFRLSPALATRPTRFEVEFKISGKFFHYGVELTGLAVVTEFLYIVHPAGGEAEILFYRKRSEDGMTSVKFASRYQQSVEDRARGDIYTRELLQPSHSLLKLLAETDYFPELSTAYSWFKDKLYVVLPDTMFLQLAEILHNNTQFGFFANDLIQKLDVGVEHIGLYGTPYKTYFGQDEPDRRTEIEQKLAAGASHIVTEVNGESVVVTYRAERLMAFRVATHHQGADGTPVMFHPHEESDGTRRIIDFMPLWELLFTDGVTAVVDEVGRSLHPKMLRSLLKLFSEGNTTGQLFFTTHDVDLLDQKLLRRDEMYMMERTAGGGTELYPLSEFKLRHDLDLRKGYLLGRFGGVPKLSHLETDKIDYAAEPGV